MIFLKFTRIFNRTVVSSSSLDSSETKLIFRFCAWFVAGATTGVLVGLGGGSIALASL